MVPAPNIITKAKYGNVQFVIYAYKKLSESECVLLVREHIRKHNIRPSENRTVKIMSTIGSTP